MSKRKYHSLCLCVSLVLLVAITLFPRSEAMATPTTLHIEPIETGEEVTYGIWKLPNTEEVKALFLEQSRGGNSEDGEDINAASAENLDKLRIKLDKASISELANKYTLITDELRSSRNGQVEIDLEPGFYYLRQVNSSTKVEVSSAIFAFPFAQAGDVNKIEPKVEFLPQPNPGGDKDKPGSRDSSKEVSSSASELGNSSTQGLNTGDQSHIWIWVLILGISGGALVGVLVKKKKR